MFLKRFIFLILIALLIATPVVAQTPAAPETETKPTKAQQEEAQKNLTAQALELLDSVVKDAERLTLPENRLYASIAAADLLWEHDEQRARTIFKNAVADLRAIFSAPDDEEQPRAYRQKMERAQMREKLIFALARHDARLARDLLAETRPQASQKNPDAPAMENEEEFEIRLAAVVAKHDPAQALEMAQKSLAKGFSNSLPTLITEIQKQDAEAAAKLTSDILTKLKTTKLAENQEASNVAFRIFVMATETKQAKASGDEKSKTPLLGEQSLRELAELLASTALNAPPEFTQQFIEIRSIMPQLEKYAPARAQALKRRSEPETGAEMAEYQSWQEFNELTQSGTVDEILAAAEKATPHMRESYYRQAAFKLVNEGKPDRARQIINERVADSPNRQQLISELDKQILATAAEKGKLEETRKFLSSARTNEE
ncbi:MAG: hypothetical protein H7Y30_16680, partial [Pyrinomonadaceae bacterium]|nr:hypothetical protein [Pyrinomonadaceae bacterium]